jgi:hypothetical protein
LRPHLLIFGIKRCVIVNDIPGWQALRAVQEVQIKDELQRTSNIERPGPESTAHRAFCKLFSLFAAPVVV